MGVIVLPSALELYREWERSAPASMMHAMMIDRADGSADQRVTITDKPYYDRGVGGVKYHHTYRAPLQCIISDIVVTESMSGTSYEDLILANANGRLDPFIGELEVGKTITCYKGDQRWSLMSDEFPNRFVCLFIAEIEEVIDQPNGTKRVRLAPKLHQIDDYVSKPDEPVAIGKPDNIPAFLVDDTTHRYRFNTRLSLPFEVTGFHRIRDNGSLLDRTTDFVDVLEGGKFLGLVELDVEPTGTVSANLWSAENYYFDALLGFLTEYMFTDYSLADETIDLSSYYSQTAMCLSADEANLYSLESIQFGNGLVIRHSLTAGDFGTATLVDTWEYETFINGIDTDWINSSARDIGIDDTGELLFILTDENFLVAIGLDDAYDPTSANASITVAKDLGSTNVSAFTFNNDFTKVYLAFVNGQIRECSMTAKDVTTINLTAVNVIDIGLQDAMSSLEIKNAGRNLYVGTSWSVTEQLELTTAYSLAEYYRPNRSYYSLTTDGIDLQTSFRVSNDLSRFWVLSQEVAVQHAFPASDGNLPIGIYSDNFGLTPTQLAGHIGHIGLFYNSPTPCGSIISDIVDCALAEFMIDRMGTLVATRMRDLDSYTPPSWLPIYDIYLGDFIGEGGTHLKQVSSIKPIRRVTVSYDINHIVQSAATLAGDVTEDLRNYYSNEKSYVTVDSVVPEIAGVVRGDYLQETGISVVGGGENVAEHHLATYEHARSDYELTAMARVGGLISGFSVGSLLRFNGNVMCRAFADQDLAIVKSRKLNSTKNIQTLTVFK